MEQLDTSGWPVWAILVLSLGMNLIVALKGPLAAILPQWTKNFFRLKEQERLGQVMKGYRQDEWHSDLVERLLEFVLDDIAKSLKKSLETETKILRELSALRAIVQKENFNSANPITNTTRRNNQTAAQTGERGLSTTAAINVGATMDGSPGQTTATDQTKESDH